MKTKNRTTTNTLICYSIIVVIFVTLKILLSDEVNLFGQISDVAKYIINVSIQVMLFVVSIFLFKALQKAKTKQVFKFYGYKKISWKGVLYAFLLGIIVYIVNVFVASFFSLALENLGYNPDRSTMDSYPWWLFLVNIVTTAIFPAVCEETAHRGMLLKGLSSYGMKKAIIISSLLFGLLHMNIEQFFYTTLIGLLLGYLTMRADCIYPAIIIHFMNNFLSTFMSFSRMNNLRFDGFFTFVGASFENNPIIAFLFMVTLFALLFILARMLIKGIIKESVLKQMNSLQDAIMTKVLRDSYFEEVAQLTNNEVRLGSESQDLQKLVHETSLSQGVADEISDSMYSDDELNPPSNLSRVLLVCCFVLMGLITFMTFIWGIFL